MNLRDSKFFQRTTWMTINGNRLSSQPDPVNCRWYKPHISMASPPICQTIFQLILYFSLFHLFLFVKTTHMFLTLKRALERPALCRKSFFFFPSSEDRRVKSRLWQGSIEHLNPVTPDPKRVFSGWTCFLYALTLH